MATKKDLRRLRIRRSIRKKLAGTVEKPRLSIYRSNKDIYAQIIDDIKGETIVAYSSKDLAAAKGTKVDVSKEVGEALAKAASEKGIETVVFDRGGYLYHGRVKALADGARSGGLKF